MSKEAIIALLTTGVVDDDVPGSDGDLKGLLIISRATAIVSERNHISRRRSSTDYWCLSQILLLMYIGCTFQALEHLNGRGVTIYANM